MVTCLATMVYMACAAHVTIFSTGGKFRPCFKFMELHNLTQATRSNALVSSQLLEVIQQALNLQM